MSPPPLCFPSTRRTFWAKKKDYDDEDHDDDDIDDKFEDTSPAPSPAHNITFRTDTESYTQYRTVAKPVPRKLIRGNTRIKPSWARGWGIDWGLGREDRKDEDKEDLLKTHILRDIPAAFPETAQSPVSQHSSLRNSEKSNDTQEEILIVPGPDRFHDHILGNSPRNRLRHGFGLGLPRRDEESDDSPTKIAGTHSVTFMDHHIDPDPTRADPVSFTPWPSPMSQSSKNSQDSKQSKDTRDSRSPKSTRGSKQSNRNQSNVSVNTPTGSALERKNVYQDPIREYVHTYARLVELRKQMTKDNLDY
jgi:hypothetical protein